MPTPDPTSLPIKTFRERRQIAGFWIDSVFPILHKNCLFYYTLYLSLSSKYFIMTTCNSDDTYSNLFHKVFDKKNPEVFQKKLTINSRIVTNDKLGKKEPYFRN